QTIVEIDGFDPLESEHAAGPSFMLSAEDRRRLEGRIAHHKKTANGSSVVGFYRSHTRKGFGLTVEDLSVMSGYFSKATDVFLLVKPNDARPGSGGFFIWEGGRIRPETPHSPFPFDSVSLLNGGYEIESPDAKPDVVKKPLATFQVSDLQETGQRL